ncbi:glycogen synthase [Deinococcus pimensis]|uniref:glycogen synthase n=1 Tax=Deinococcus pimensis TaxID=309888 RepID=UPI0004B9BEAC|nr:glycogen/starch synthase [Deinococcus pimensis]
MTALRVLHVASEVYPFSRTGGLADVLDALPRALAGLGTEVTVLSPWYRDIQPKPQLVAEFGEVHVGEVREHGVRYLFLGLPEFDRGGVYHPDDVWRFVRFCRAALPALDALGVSFDVLHAHDWAAGLLTMLARERGVRTVFTIHNLQYQGRWNAWEAFSWTGLPEGAYPALEFFGDINLMKAGLLSADVVTTVSPTYAREITTPEFGEGLDPVLRERFARKELVGLLNGLDVERWDPGADPEVKAYRTYKGKAPNTRALRKEIGLRGKPVLATVTRLVEQKGIDVLVDALPELTKDWDVVVLGSGDPRLEAALREHDGQGVRYYEGMNEPLAHRIYAGADAFVMPSRFEPCGLSQMIAMRYGTPPIVRTTGGLKDSVPKDVGFHFQKAGAAALVRAARSAAKALEDPAGWRERAELGMAHDFSWGTAARRYLDLYAPAPAAPKPKRTRKAASAPEL